MNVKKPEKVLAKPICTWLSEKDHARFTAVVKKQGVTIAAYLRGIVVDAIEEEEVAGKA